MTGGRVIIVTGAASGIGRASALAFAEVGAQVVVADDDETGGAETVAAIEAAGGEAVFVPADVTDDGQVEALVAGAVARFGRLDWALNNAGTTGAGGPAPGLQTCRGQRPSPASGSHTSNQGSHPLISPDLCSSLRHGVSTMSQSSAGSILHPHRHGRRLLCYSDSSVESTTPG